MASTLEVIVVDPSGAAVAVERVTLKADGLQTVKSAAPYRFDLSLPGTGQVSIEKAGSFPYAFGLSFSGSGDAVTTKIAPSIMVDKPRMAAIATTQATTRDGAKRTRNVLTITVGPPAQVVLAVGHDYKGGTTMRAFATARMHDIAKERGDALDDSTVFTVIECTTGEISHWVRGRGHEDLGPGYRWISGWSRVGLLALPPPNLSRTPPIDPGPDAIGMPRIFQEVENIGRLRPGSMFEFSILSHAWFGGPILFNTDERPEYWSNGVNARARDPKDTDGRFQKDFTPEANLPNIVPFQNAFRDDCYVKVWGCFSSQAYRDAIDKARAATSDTELLSIPEEQRKLWFYPQTVYPDTKPGFLQFLRESAYKANYMYFLARVCRRPVWGSPWGAGAAFLGSKFGVRMYVPAPTYKWKDGELVVADGGYRAVVEFLRETMGWEWDADNYVKYQP